MPTVAVIGGIGCGKSAVTDLLASHGATVVDADAIAREVVAPGTPALAALVDAFGAGIVTAGGALDRGALAKVAFAEPSATAKMNAILHPAIGLELYEQVRAARDVARVVVVAIPLFRHEHRAQLGIDLVVCIDCSAAFALERLVRLRGLTETDAALRMAAQPTREERRALADVVIDNDGTYDELTAAVDHLWDQLAA